MRSKLKLQIFISMLSVCVLFTIGTDFVTGSNNDADPHTNAPENSKFHVQNTQLVELHSLPIPRLNVGVIDTTIASQSTQNTTPIVEQPPIITVTTDQYEVTSHYLNVRTNKNANSKILHVVKNGDILEVLEPTDNNWLKLKNGGYVHGNYVRLISERVELKKANNIHKLSNSLSPIKQSPNKPTKTVKSDSELTEEQIALIFEGTLLADHGLEQTILETEKEYGINAYFTIAVMKLESGHGKSKLAKEKNNLFGLNAIDGDAFNKAFSFKTKGDSIEKFGQLISDNYIDQGLTSVEKVASKYCNANPKWSALVMKIMERDYKKLTKDLG